MCSRLLPAGAATVPPGHRRPPERLDVSSRSRPRSQRCHRDSHRLRRHSRSVRDLPARIAGRESQPSRVVFTEHLKLARVQGWRPRNSCRPPWRIRQGTRGAMHALSRRRLVCERRQEAPREGRARDGGRRIGTSISGSPRPGAPLMRRRSASSTAPRAIEGETDPHDVEQ